MRKAGLPILVGLVVVALASAAQATMLTPTFTMSGVSAEAVADNNLTMPPSARPVLTTDFKVSQLHWNAASDYTNAELVITLSTGTMYRTKRGGSLQQFIARTVQDWYEAGEVYHTDPADINPAMAVDSFVQAPEYYTDTAGNPVPPIHTGDRVYYPISPASVAGGASVLTQTRNPITTATNLNIAFGDNKPFSLGDVVLAQICMSPDAVGTWQMVIYEAGIGKVFDSRTAGGPGFADGFGHIAGGQFIIPEPAAMALLIVGGIGTLLRRRRQA